MDGMGRRAGRCPVQADGPLDEDESSCFVPFPRVMSFLCACLEEEREMTPPSSHYNAPGIWSSVSHESP